MQNEHDERIRRIPDPRLIKLHARTSTCRCCRPPKSSPSATASRRDAQDEYALQSQQRTAAAQAAGKFDDEIVPVTGDEDVKDKKTGEVSDTRP